MLASDPVEAPLSTELASIMPSWDRTLEIVRSATERKTSQIAADIKDQSGRVTLTDASPVADEQASGLAEVTPSSQAGLAKQAFAPRVQRPAIDRPAPKPAPQIKRWSFDTWLFVRSDSAAPNAVGPLPASYGASQAGGVLRYRLNRTSEHRPTLYVRATSALSGAREADLAAGFAVRPIVSVPVSVQAEARLSDVSGRREIRPAVLAVTELPLVEFPLGFRGEAYAQAGYVGGDFATPFADGQAKLDRKILDLAGAELRAGGGVWGGAQKGASRIDAGPTASVRFDLKDVPVRLSADYRHRVAGDAVPQSGIAFTLSTGF